MDKNRRQFPLVGDNEPVVSQPRQMALYENEDLITNIKGAYRERVYGEGVPAPRQASQAISRSTSSATGPVLSGFEPAEKGRQEAKANLRQKRQHLVAKDPHLQPKSLPIVPKPVLKQTPESDKGWGKYAENLRQEHYILAEVPKTYKEPSNPSTKKPVRNNYDYLKRSQIYNQEANQRQKERQVAQELNLSRFEDLN